MDILLSGHGIWCQQTSKRGQMVRKHSEDYRRL